MRKVLVSVAGALGLAALVRALRRRGSAPDTATPSADPADELRAAIADSKAAEAHSEAAAEPPPTLEERRRRVHERAQEAIDAMQEPPPGA